MVRTQSYRGTGPEVVLVGFEEICCVGYAEDKHLWIKEGRLNLINLALKMGILAYQANAGKPEMREILLPPKEPQDLPLPCDPANQKILHEQDVGAMDDFAKRWGPYIREHTGLRRLRLENCGFDPNNFQTLGVERIRRENLTAKEFQLLKELQLQLEDVVQTGDHFAATVVKGTDEPFPFPLDFGGPLPTGWRFDNLGLPPKEIRKMNSAILMLFEACYRILLNSTLHPEQERVDQIFDPKRLALHTPTGMGPMNEIEAMGLATFRGEWAKPKQLSHSLANTSLGYLAPALNFKGKISTHVGACESVMGGIGDLYRDLKSGNYDAGMVIGYDWAMTAVAYNGFVANGAFIINEQVLKAVRAMIQEGVVTDSDLISAVEQRLSRDQALQKESADIDQRMKAKTLSREEGRQKKTDLQKQRIKNYQNLPKRVYEMASMPFNKHRGGFVMSIGAGGGLFTTLDFAVKHGLPIRALVAGAGEKIPDGAGDGYGSIAVLGDGVGDAFEKSFLEARENYAIRENNDTRRLSINDIAAWWAHGTSTPTNGYGESREIHRILEKYNRDPSKPILLSGDKEIGHRIGGNFPSEACFILEEQTIYPLKNYTVADPEILEKFPLTRVVGKAGAGQGKPIPVSTEFVAINGAGFGKINSNLMFKKFRLDELNISEAEKEAYTKRLHDRLAEAKILAEKIRKNQTPLFKDVSDTAKSRGEASEMSKLVE